jgi:putative Ca2+/H+ antiporter (TMEM165/GDT1 family)
MPSVVLLALTLTFVAEWGDRSQIATIALASAKNPVGVTVGAIVGHCVCTASACVGGRMLAANIQEKTVSQCGGLIFLLFGLHSLLLET